MEKPDEEEDGGPPRLARSAFGITVSFHTRYRPISAVRLLYTNSDIFFRNLELQRYNVAVSVTYGNDKNIEKMLH